MLEATFDTVFTAGHEAGGPEFNRILHIGLVPDGRVVVLELTSGGSRGAVTVLAADGREVANWGRQGAGPGELLGGFSLSLRADTAAVANTWGIGLYELSSGEEIRRHSPLPGYHDGLVFGPDGGLLASKIVVGADEELNPAREFHLIGVEDASTLRRSTAEYLRAPFEETTIFAPLPGHRLVWGRSHRYALEVIDLASGETIDSLGRRVEARRMEEGFVEKLRRHWTDPPSAPGGWLPLLRWPGPGDRSETSVMLEHVGDPFPLVLGALAGPDGRGGTAVWVQRGLGVGDEFAPPVDPPAPASGHLLWDLFSLDGYDFLGTVRVPERFLPKAGNSSVVAGVLRDEKDVEAVQLLRPAIPPAR